MFAILSCVSDDPVTEFIPPPAPDLSHPNDVFLYNNNGESLYERLGISLLWRWDDNYIRAHQRATAVREDVVINSAKLIDYLWVGSFEAQGKAGEDFIKKYSPPEIVLIGSYIYNDDGTILLGFAESGVRITLLNMNAFDFQDIGWLLNTSSGVVPVILHEFSHIIHQKNDIPDGFREISDSYLGSSWSNGVSFYDAIKLGMVRNYATMNEYEDFCEIVSHYVSLPQAVFDYYFIDQEDCSVYSNYNDIVECSELNEGRQKISRKLELTKKYFSDKFDIDLSKVRDTIQTRTNKVIQLNDIPDS